MNKYISMFIFCFLAINLVQSKSIANSTNSDVDVLDKETALRDRPKRQVPLFPLDVSYMDYAAYDYYDWVCDAVSCQLCDVLTGVCCTPNGNNNCFLPDSCANNPCLSGGTCVPTTARPANRQTQFPDFVCVCQRGLTGKYCQLIDEFTPPLVAPIPLPVPVPAPAPAPAPGPAPGGIPSPGFGAMGGMNPMAGMMGGMNPMAGMMGGMNPFAGMMGMGR